MKELLDLGGIVTVLNTPFTNDDQIDLASLKRNVNLAIKAGVTGLLVPAMASEVEKLFANERELIVKTVLDEVNGRVPVIGGASAKSETERLQISKSLISMGCNGILVSIPYESDQKYVHDVRAIAELEPEFLMLQDWDFKNYGIPIPLIVKLFNDIDVFKSLKIEVVPAGVKYTEVLEATRGKLHIAGGWAVSQMIEGLDRGIHAFMPTGMHEIYTAIYNSYKQGNRKKAIEIFYRIIPVLAFANQHLDISIHFFKNLLFEQGIYSTPNVRVPILPFDNYHQKIAKELIELVNILTSEILQVE